MNRTKLNYVVDLAFLIQFVLVGYSGILLLIDGYGVSHFWKFIHVKIGILSLVFFTIHLVLHWAWLVSNSKKCFGINEKVKADEIIEAKYTNLD
ncbi:DUF4405 domain-containing protein [Methanosarcina sp.]|jgi:hypothetical protein|uniref:DUF4405 domain-containing protein n=1 Tax=Methanosarcina sp. TaxID=2213 RepID=UPI002D0F4934|nr:DUF4405 domain-containing protein [Methanosarcina sp.]HOW14715.1 DUF4405 domain-containing protein [Methanosarcina sp.]